MLVEMVLQEGIIKPLQLAAVVVPEALVAMLLGLEAWTLLVEMVELELPLASLAVLANTRGEAQAQVTLKTGWIGTRKRELVVVLVQQTQVPVVVAGSIEPLPHPKFFRRIQQVEMVAQA
jgi:hypothetical protein